MYDNRATTLVFTYSDPDFIADKTVAIIFDTLDDMGVPQNYIVGGNTFQIPWAVMSRVNNNKLRYQLAFIGSEPESPAVYNTRIDTLQVSIALSDVGNTDEPVVEDLASSMWAKKHAVLFPPTYENGVLTFRTAVGDESGNRIKTISFDTGYATDTELQAEVTRATGAENALDERVGDIESKIPSEATDTNQLADKAYVDSKAPLAHTHAISDVTNLQDNLNSKLDDSQLITTLSSTASDTKIMSEKLARTTFQQAGDYVQVAGDTMEGALLAATSAETSFDGQMRNIHLGYTKPSDDLGANGEVWVQIDHAGGEREVVIREVGGTYRGTYTQASQLPANADAEDIAYVGTAAPYQKYVYSGSAWELEGTANNPPDYVLEDDLSAHTNNSTIHVTAANKTAWDAKYDKPSTGIPKTDLASAVQTSLGKADTALQSHQSIKTINNTAMVGAGNITLQTPLTAGTDYVVPISGKGLSTNDYTTAEKNKLAGLATVATSGSYNDLSNKPTIPTIPSVTVVDNGAGNAVTDVTASGHTVTLTRGKNFIDRTGDTMTGMLKADQTNNSQSDGTGQVRNTYVSYSPPTDTLGIDGEIWVHINGGSKDLVGTDIDSTALALKADQATTYTKSETDTLLAGYVTLNTAQTIPGAKTFENNNTFKGQTLFERNDDQIKLINPNLEVGTMPSSSSLISTLLLCDKNGTYVGFVSHRMQTNGRGQGRFIAYNYDKSANAELTLNCDADGYKYGQVPNRPYANTTSSDIVNIALLDAYTPMVRTTGNQTKSGTMTFLDAIYGRLIDPLYEEYSGALPSGKYRIFARIPASNPNSMIVLDAMVSANGGNYGYGRMIIGNPTTTTWFCKWVLRKSGGFLSATSIQIAREVATGDLVVLALNPTYTGLAISLVYSKTGGSIHGAERVTKVTSSADYALDGTDTDLENIIPGSDMA